MATDEKQLEHRNVVSSFLIDYSKSNPQVALFHRSNKVNTYQGKLAPISGSVSRSDKSIFAAALRELEEETTLKISDDLTLNLCGPPFDIIDETVGRKWTVHPFSFILSQDSISKIQIDWEHTEFVWVDPRDVLGGKYRDETVPRLEESLRRCWLGPGSMFDDSQKSSQKLSKYLQTLKNDHESGAKQMAGNALVFLRETFENIMKSDQYQNLWNQLLFIAWHLIYNGRESMNAAIATTLLKCLKSVSGKKLSADRLLGGIKQYEKDRKAASKRIAQEFLKFVKGFKEMKDKINIITISSSSTFYSVFLHLLSELSDYHINLSILESRPLFEGVTLASKFLSTSTDKLHVTIVPDSSISHALPSSTGPVLFVLGADRISSNGDVSNKSGSLPLVLTAREFARQQKNDFQTVVLSEVDKIAKDSPVSHEGDEENDPTEIVKAWDAVQVQGMEVIQKEMKRASSKLKVVNKYFEWVPAEHIDVYISDIGPLNRQQIVEQSREVARLEEEIFGELYTLA